MKNIFVTLWQRSKDLIAKFISTKGAFVVVSTVVYFREPTNITLAALVGSWAMMIGFREMEKFKGWLPGPKE